jgi:acyl-CoA-binding protein
MSDLDAKFNETAEWVRKTPMPANNDEKLLCYSLFKQATKGDVEGDQPWAVQFEARAKYDAWAKVRGMNQDDAKEKYIAEVARQRQAYGY